MAVENLEVNRSGISFESNGRRVEVRFYRGYNTIEVDGDVVHGYGGDISEIANHIIQKGVSDELAQIIRRTASLSLSTQKRWCDRIADNLNNLGKMVKMADASVSASQKISQTLARYSEAEYEASKRGWQPLPNGLLVSGGGWGWFFFHVDWLDGSCKFYTLLNVNSASLGKVIVNRLPLPINDRLREKNVKEWLKPDWQGYHSRRYAEAFRENLRKALEQDFPHKSVINAYVVSQKLES